MLPEAETCGCGHPAAAHERGGCEEWRRYPEVLHARPCGCEGFWRCEKATR